MDCKKAKKELDQMCQQRLANETNPIEKFKCLALKECKAGIKTIGRKFRIMDDSGNRKLSWEEFEVGCRECRIAKMSPDELKKVFVAFDKDNNGQLDFDEFLFAVRPKMNKMRQSLVGKAFAKMDRTGDQKITVDDLVGLYDVTKHPKFANGEMSKKEVLLEFLSSFDAEDNADGVVTLEEFTDYYSGISASIDNDAYFSLMMFNSWQVKPTE